MLTRRRHLVLTTVALLATTMGSVYAQATAQTKLEVTGVQFEPLQQGKNVVRVEVKNTSSQDQVFRTHIQTQSPNYGRAGWGAGFFKTILAGATVGTRFVFKIQGPVTESTSIRLTFSNPGPQAGFSEEAWSKGEGWNQWFKRTEYQARDLAWAKDDSSDQPAAAEQANAITQVFRRIQNSVETKDYAQTWQFFTTDYQQAEFQTTGLARFAKAMEPQDPVDSAFVWERDPFLSLKPQRVVRRGAKLVLQAAAPEGTWTVDFVEEQGQWKIDWIAGYTPRFLRWQNWEEYTLPRMKKRATEHFDIFFFPGSTAERYIERIARGKEEGYWGICNFLGADANVRIKLVLFEDKTTKHRETGHQGMGGAYDRTIVEVYNEKESLDPYHETVHILMGSRGSPPALFNEGLAVYLSQRLGAHALKDLDGGEATIENRVKELKAQGDWIDLAGLMTYTEIGSDRSRSSVAYPEAASFVKFLIDTYGRDKFLQAYGRLKNSGDREVQARNVAELAAIYGQSLSQLRNAWEAWLVVVAPPSAAVPVTRLFIHVTADGKTPAPSRLLPTPEETADGDAFELYEKATGLLPKDLDWGLITRWRQMAVKDLPLEEVATALRPCEASLALLEQAGKRRQCDWPAIVEDEPPSFQACRSLVLLLSLKARCHLGRGDYPSCVRTLETGFALVRHLKAGPNVVYSMYGAAAVAILCREVESYVQQPGSPSLEAALRALPTPLFYERPADIGGEDPNGQAKIQLMLRSVNRRIIALQYIEALRSYTTKAGRWPEALDSLPASLPADPVTDKPFTYRRPTETQAVLTGPVPEGGQGRDGIHYELSIVEDP